MQLVAKYDPATKGVKLENLPEEAWKTVLGDGKASGALALYEAVSALYRAVNIRADAIAGMPCQVSRGEQVIEQPERALAWWDRLPTLLDGIEADRVLFGAAYVLIERNAYSVFKGLRRLQPGTVRLDADEEQGLKGFKRVMTGREVPLALEDMLWSWVPNRRTEIGPGTAPVATALEAAGLIKNADSFASAYFAKGAIKALLIDIEEGMPSEQEQVRLENWIQRRIVGIRNAFAANVGRRKLNVHEIGQGTGDLALPELNDKKREDIATALGVPHSILFSNAANYATAEQDALNFLDYTIVPEVQKIQADLNEHLFAPLGLRFEFQPGRLEAYQAREAKKGALVLPLVQQDVITRKEAREALGYPVEIPEGYADERPDPEPVPTPLVINGQARETMPIEAELRQWERKAVRRLEEGKPAKALEFEGDAIGATLAAAIKGALEVVVTPAEARRVFQAALWQGYP